MTAEPTWVDPTIKAWLDEPVFLPDNGLAQALERVHQTPQQRHRWPAIPTRRSRSMSIVLRFAAASLAFSLIGGTLALAIGPQSDGPPAPAAAAPGDTEAPPSSRTAAPSATETAGTLDWSTPSIGFEVDRMRLRTNGLVFKGDGSPSFKAYTDKRDGEYNVAWREHDREMRLEVFVKANDTHWWVSSIRTWDGTPESDYLMYKGLSRETRTPIGETLETDLRLSPVTVSNPTKRATLDAARLRLDGLRLTAFGPGTRPAPLEVTGCQPLPDEAVSADDSWRIDPAFEPLQGIEGLPAEEAGSRLESLGLCHEFRYSYPVDDEARSDVLAYSERWCSVPPVVSPVSPELAASPSDPQHLVPGIGAWISPERYVVIKVVDSEPRDGVREQPAAGWDCPTE